MPRISAPDRPRAGLRAAATIGVLLALLAPLTAVAAARNTAAGDARAASVLLARSEIGRGWSETAPPSSVPPLTCPAFNPSLRGDVEIGAAISPRFQGSQSGPFVSQVAYVYATPAQGVAAARALLRARLGRCFASSLVAGSGGGVTFKVLRQESLGLPRLGVDAAGYRVAGTASQAGQPVDVYLDAIVLADGPTITEISYATFFQPPSRSLELKLARRLARLIAAP
jgi:hypothetical protein